MKALSLQRDLAGIALSYQDGAKDVVRGFVQIIKVSMKLVRLLLRAILVAPEIGIQIEPGKIEYVRAARDRFPEL